MEKTKGREMVLGSTIKACLEQSLSSKSECLKHQATVQSFLTFKHLKLLELFISALCI